MFIVIGLFEISAAACLQVIRVVGCLFISGGVVCCRWIVCIVVP